MPFVLLTVLLWLLLVAAILVACLAVSLWWRR